MLWNSIRICTKARGQKNLPALLEPKQSAFYSPLAAYSLGLPTPRFFRFRFDVILVLYIFFFFLFFISVIKAPAGEEIPRYFFSRVTSGFINTRDSRRRGELWGEGLMEMQLDWSFESIKGVDFWGEVISFRSFGINWFRVAFFSDALFCRDPNGSRECVNWNKRVR